MARRSSRRRTGSREIFLVVGLMSWPANVPPFPSLYATILFRFYDILILHIIVDEEDFAVTKEELKDTEEKDSADSDIDVPEDFAAEQAVLGDETEEKKPKVSFYLF